MIGRLEVQVGQKRPEKNTWIKLMKLMKLVLSVPQTLRIIIGIKLWLINKYMNIKYTLRL